MSEFSVIGQPLPRHDAVSQVTGKSIYGADVVRPGMLHMKILRAKYPHAKIINIDTSAAMKLPGVRCVITHADIEHNIFGWTHIDQPVLCGNKVRYMGDPVAAVAAETPMIAKKALDLIKVDYEVLPVVTDPREGMKDGATLVHDELGTNIVSHQKIRNGDIEEGWKNSDRIIEESLSTPMIEHAMIEPHAGVAEYDETGLFTVWTTTQRPSAIVGDLSSILQVPTSKVRVAATAVGGGFGGKNEQTWEAMACVLSKKTRRPIRHVFEREDEFRSSTVRHAYYIKYKTGLKNDGTFVAREVEIISDAGPYVTHGESTLKKALIHSAGPYIIPYTKIDGYLVYTNNLLAGAMRGFGVTQLGFAYEAHMDTIAEEMGIDPIELRMKNIYHDNDCLPTGQQLPVVSLEETIRTAIKAAGWEVKL